MWHSGLARETITIRLEPVPEGAIQWPSIDSMIGAAILCGMFAFVAAFIVRRYGRANRRLTKIVQISVPATSLYACFRVKLEGWEALSDPATYLLFVCGSAGALLAALLAAGPEEFHVDPDVFS